MNNYDFSLERRLKELDPNLHARFTDTDFALQQILSNYQLIFPLFTDHTELHSLNIIEFCNKLIGEQVYKLNADEIYCILMGCYFHDTGMGVSKEDFVEFSKKIDFLILTYITMHFNLTSLFTTLFFVLNFYTFLNHLG